MRKMELNKTYLGDCLDVMKLIDNNSIDMILCDLPYGTTACKWDTVLPFDKLWAQYERIIKPNGAIVLTSDGIFTGALMISNPKMFKYKMIWDKKISTGFLNAKKRPLRRHEDILVFAKSATTYNPIMVQRGAPRTKGSIKRSDSAVYSAVSRTESFNDTYYPTSIVEVSNADRKGKVHPTQKPVALFEYLIKTYTNEGDVVLDNCAGSGTTAEAL